MLRVRYSKKYRKAIKKYSRSGQFDIKWVEDVVLKISKGEKLVDKYKDHPLSGDLQYCRECHIKPDLLLMYRIYKEELVLLLLNLGSHPELFG